MVAAECRKAYAEGLVSLRCPRSCGCRRALGKIICLANIILSWGTNKENSQSHLRKHLRQCLMCTHVGGGWGSLTLLPWGAQPQQTYKVPVFQVLISAPSPQILQKPTHELKQQLAGYSKRVASSVTELIQAAEAMKGKERSCSEGQDQGLGLGWRAQQLLEEAKKHRNEAACRCNLPGFPVFLGTEWVDPEDPTVIAENELLGAAAAIEAAAKKLEQLKPRAKPKVTVLSPCLTFMLSLGWDSSACALASFEAPPDSLSLLLYSCYLPHPQLDFPQVAHALMHPTALNPALHVSPQPPAAILLFCSICPSTPKTHTLLLPTASRREPELRGADLGSCQIHCCSHECPGEGSLSRPAGISGPRKSKAIRGEEVNVEKGSPFWGCL